MHPDHCTSGATVGTGACGFVYAATTTLDARICVFFMGASIHAVNAAGEHAITVVNGTSISGTGCRAATLVISFTGVLTAGFGIHCAASRSCTS
jgi:hypothetical protein